ncbi:MAG TPA: hypothetical protein VL443_16035 [Cyclobacteriaceae bacterium]|jgi:hypothetical protein|nr:hypothetical protein [Cyclobacteriaceae bacterium]
MRTRFILLISLIAPLALHGQFKKIKTVEVSEDILTAYVDRPGDLYIATVTGQFQKFDKDGKLALVYKNNPAPELFDPRDGARLFAFYRSNRQYAYLNPSFDFNKSFVIDSAFVLEPWLVCASGDFNVWVLDGADATMRKINVNKGQVDAEVKLPASFDVKSIRSMREYQGMLFVLTDDAIMIYNSIGKAIKTINTKSAYVNFLGEEMYYLQDGKLRFVDLFTGDIRDQALPAPCTMALLTDERLYLIQQKSIDLFEVKPNK